MATSGPSCSTQAYSPCNVGDLSSPTRDQGHTPYIGRQILNNWTTREVPKNLNLKRKQHNEI